MPRHAYAFGPIVTATTYDRLFVPAAGVVIESALYAQSVSLRDEVMAWQQTQAAQPRTPERTTATAQSFAAAPAAGVVIEDRLAAQVVRLQRGAAMTVDALGTVETVEPRAQKASVLSA